MRIPLRSRPTQLRAGRLDAQGPQGFAPCLFPRGVFYSAGHPTEAGACEPRALRRALPHIHDQERGFWLRSSETPGKSGYAFSNNAGMDRTDSRLAHPPEPASDDAASPLNAQARDRKDLLDFEPV